MRNGKSIFYVAAVFFVGWILAPAWQWYFDHFLDTAAKSNGVIATIEAEIPQHPFLLGISLGMGLALFIGYWPSILNRALQIPSEIMSGIEFVRNIFPRGRVIFRGAVSFDEHELEKVVQVDQAILEGAAEVRMQPYSNIYGYLWYPGRINFKRTDSAPKTAWFEVISD